MAWRIIYDSELEYFESALYEAGFGLNDFVLSETVNPLPPSAEVLPLTGTVTITSRITGVAKTYPAGYGTHWPADFANDLVAGVFGRM